MNVWETEDEYATALQASLPTPADTPYRTPSRQSRRSSRQKSASPVPSSSPPPLSHGETSTRRSSKDVSNDESISILDPRRFTPTLHANLVSEILNLRRDQEEKAKIIESLESNLHSSRTEAETLTTTLASNAKETRSLKRQLALLEGGTSSALGELARERDEAVDSVTEVRRRLELAQKKLRTQEDDANRTQELWTRDKDSWEDEKRKYERKIHVAEGRLKAVLEEVAAYQAVHQQGLPLNGDVEPEENSRENATGHGSDTASVRSMSLTNSIRFSMLNGPNGYGGSKLNGVSLADELNLEEDDGDQPTDQEGHDIIHSIMHRRNESRDSVMSKTEKRNQTMDLLMRPGSSARGKFLGNQTVLDKLQGGISEDDEIAVSNKPQYTDSGVQYSPPPSPELKAAESPEIHVEGEQPRGSGHQDAEVEANQRRKRVHASPSLVLEPPVSEKMVSAASQTLDGPLSPPRTPKSPSEQEQVVVGPEMKSSSTQTDEPWSLPREEAPRLPIPIPSISIHPPTSRPATPREPLLPQHFKDVACQASLQLPVSSRSISVQTEDILSDRRLNLLPKHLQPSMISSRSASPEPSTQEVDRSTSIPAALPPRNPRRVTRENVKEEIPSSPPQPIPFTLPQPTIVQQPIHPQQPTTIQQSVVTETSDAYPGNNDDGPLSKERSSIRRPHRISSLFAGFENVSSDEADDFADADMSDSDFRTALSAPKPKKSIGKFGKRTSVTPTSVPEDVEPVEQAKPRQAKSSVRQPPNNDTNGTFALPDTSASAVQKASMKSVTRQMDKPLTLVTTAKQGTMRRAALISNGIAAHQGRSRSPSLPDAVKEPPFPIPTRASSRKLPFSASAPSEGSRSPTRDSWASHRRRGSNRGQYRANSIRKVRSAAAIPGGGHRYRRRTSRSPPPLSASTEAPESPQLPPMPNNDITSPYLSHHDNNVNGQYGAHRQQLSTNTADTTYTGAQSLGSSGQATSVVDAIAQTMVGEWMWKYVRKRKSFGVPDTAGPDGDAANGVRHKRWVWLAPYERAVMWSSKQPTSGSALMGKSGRKLTIQSVLDVKDDNVAPKGTAGAIFNRSILILTPARALKFTAPSGERHYIWLTALSFLAHSSQAIPEVVAPAPAQQIPDFELPSQTAARIRKNPIRDSIRVAKGRNTAAPQSGPASVQSSIRGTNAGGELSIRTESSARGGASMGDHSIREGGSSYGSHDGPAIAADPPVIPRFSDRAYSNTHGRKRSNTGSRIPPPLSFRGFSDRGPTTASGSMSTASINGGNGGYSGNGYTHGHAPASSTAGLSIGTTGSSDIYNASGRSSSAMGGNSLNYNGMSASGRSSIRTSDASTRPNIVVNNFFDAVGTVRMEAFISPMALTRFDDYPDETEEMRRGGPNGFDRNGPANGRRSREWRRRSRNMDGYYAGRGRVLGDIDDWYGGSKTAGEEEYGSARGDDPFRGF